MCKNECLVPENAYLCMQLERHIQEMKQYKLTAPERLAQTIQLPASKSISNRALIIYALSGGRNLPQNLSDCDDTEVIIEALRYMPDEINIKAAGTAMRFMTVYLSVMRGTHVITGTERMQHRPIAILVDALRKLGAQIEYVGQEGFPPLKITGYKLQGGEPFYPWQREPHSTFRRC